MFYSHQLLARKAPLGQIWMAATLHAKINRRKLDKLDIIKICEEILNPTVPMALRLSGILMGGVVIVYERKVKLLYDDVSRLLIEINEAWRIKPAADPTVLPKGKTQANCDVEELAGGLLKEQMAVRWRSEVDDQLRYEAVTLPEDMLGMEVEQPMIFSEVDTAKFRRMCLEDLDEQYVNINLEDDDFSHAQHQHQAETVNITLFDDYGSGFAETTDMFNRFERFDIADETIQVNVTPHEQPQVPSSLIPSPPRQDEPPQPQEQYNAVPSPVREEPPQGAALEEQEKQKMKRQQPQRRKASRNSSRLIIDNDQIMIPGNVYQTWLQDSSSIVSKRRKISNTVNLICSTKLSNLMDLPPVALISGTENSVPELYYPGPLIQLWRKCAEVRSPGASPSGKSSSLRQEHQPRNSPPEAFRPQDIPEIPQEAYQSEMGSHPMDFTENIEKLRANLNTTDYDRAYDLQSDHSATPGSPGQSHISASSSGGSSRKFMPLEPEVLLPSGRSKRRNGSSMRSLGNLDPVEEEFALEQDVRDFKIRRLSEIGPTPELLEETVPTQTPFRVPSDHTIDKVTQSIRTHLKLHFDTPGAPQSESLDQLAYGMNPAKAAQLFYQTCVLATLDFIKVKQVEAYGDISISRGPKM